MKNFEITAETEKLGYDPLQLNYTHVQDEMKLGLTLKGVLDKHYLHAKK